ncbi:DNA-binding domain-containing protein [Methylocystis sp. MJC1]|uniref:HvfC/BufC N-terminal domain-containing protein n=1 Tax=Methylocystis sp. MJC1 TaxID=2654282 RepID=UPI0013EE36C9|nr:DNA-binding domain-containing protein [Methylocystis sp. MJC1]KAF2989861.1 hypothetical protein MJC1_02997 [Methylocystis sp. MJC1]MBU6528372.1 putative DNA-binding domain-containing protein [Methylocystis sp. MJC1]UZX11276.1 DNA-binding domain-containing protein [Methylocystis sp. MJC1]
MTLLSFQRAFQAAILKAEVPSATTLAFVGQPRLIDRVTAFGVYYNAYRLRLAEFISTDFAILRSYLGDEDFGRLVEEYVMAKPSIHRNARWYARGLPEFMEQSDSWGLDRSACDLARFERALADAFDAADAPASSAQTLHQIDAADWPNLVLSFHPSANLLTLSRGTATLYESLTEGRTSAPASPPYSDETVLVWRSEYETFHRIVDNDERLALSEAMRAKTFADVCSLLSFRHNGDDVSVLIGGFLSGWFADGLIVSLQIKA